MARKPAEKDTYLFDNVPAKKKKTKGQEIRRLIGWYSKTRDRSRSGYAKHLLSKDLIAVEDLPLAELYLERLENDGLNIRNYVGELVHHRPLFKERTKERLEGVLASMGEKGSVRGWKEKLRGQQLLKFSKFRLPNPLETIDNLHCLLIKRRVEYHEQVAAGIRVWNRYTSGWVPSDYAAHLISLELIPANQKEKVTKHLQDLKEQGLNIQSYVGNLAFIRKRLNEAGTKEKLSDVLKKHMARAECVRIFDLKIKKQKINGTAIRRLSKLHQIVAKHLANKS